MNRNAILYVLPIAALTVAGCFTNAATKSARREAERIARPASRMEVAQAVAQAVEPCTTTNDVELIARRIYAERPARPVRKSSLEIILDFLKSPEGVAFTAAVLGGGYVTRWGQRTIQKGMAARRATA
jgi:hypothetical protein